MKKLILSLFVISALFLSSCETDSTEDVSEVTVFAELSLLGDPIMFSPVGQPFADPGADASIGGASAPFETVSNVDTSTPGFYNVTYIATNDDGFQASANRQVIVYEDNGTIAGIYDGIRVGRDDGGLVLISQISADQFYISDLLAGWYEFGPNGYGPAYAWPATINVSGNSVTSPGASAGFGPAAISNGNINNSGPSTVITWDILLTDYNFGFPVQFTKITP
ncbi:immunoglobulin-like domain-containing protein [Winogradskyella schleiferi]|uniref:immunoglobulin-like domain-containing protein n=1 Tax=Winogradskyella schleiferi TaxID=2686078 RepID=UPI0015BFA87C|nr:immunoglobulin-like domain-containing protein [Winogradskyella schleiferi]